MFRCLFVTLGLMALAMGPAPAQEARPVLVFAAASLQTAFNAIAAAWQKEKGGKVTFSYAASSALARQLEQGAPADLFASADLDWMDWAQQRNLIRPETRRTLLENTLVLIEPADRPPTPLKIGPGFALAEALGDGRLATGQVQSVPVGRYAQQALTHLGLWETIRPRIAGVENVRTALALVARGEARFGIVYATDAKAEPRVRVVDAFPAGSHPPILYPLAVTANAGNAQAQSFLDYLSSPAAIRIFEAEGFRVTR
ncbi:molybdate ABC transporter substrate-binding protein [Rhabdaerophilum sp. SD176]|uniref:molybdate ABC transporter substrate-binding protein n=1 Tax=Rhabdaerophilum sp. SD176 TaxID=2983548 RepID=UPI0024DFCE2E|nr:molybdate ABC transporter substrate-binding protein [Rhabdaerophilum sp. SD176]